MSITRKSSSWEIKNSLWIIWSFTLILNGVGMFVAGKKVNEKKWRDTGLLYIAASWIAIMISGGSKGIFGTIGTVLGSIIYLACIINSFAIRNEYLIRLERIEGPDSKPFKSKVVNNHKEKNRQVNNRSINNYNENDNIYDETQNGSNIFIIDNSENYIINESDNYIYEENNDGSYNETYDQTEDENYENDETEENETYEEDDSSEYETEENSEYESDDSSEDESYDNSSDYSSDDSSDNSFSFSNDSSDNSSW